MKACPAVKPREFCCFCYLKSNAADYVMQLLESGGRNLATIGPGILKIAIFVSWIPLFAHDDFVNFSKNHTRLLEIS